MMYMYSYCSLNVSVSYHETNVVCYLQENIKAASSLVQRDIKLTFEMVFQHIIKCWLMDGSDIG